MSLVPLVLLAAASCAAKYDVGSTPEEQLCHVLKAVLRDHKGATAFR